MSFLTALLVTFIAAVAIAGATVFVDRLPRVPMGGVVLISGLAYAAGRRSANKS